jgi:hypothetical protein
VEHVQSDAANAAREVLKKIDSTYDEMTEKATNLLTNLNENLARLKRAEAELDARRKIPLINYK